MVTRFTSLSLSEEATCPWTFRGLG